MNDEVKNDKKAALKRAVVGGVEIDLAPMRFKFSSDGTLQKDAEFGFSSVEDFEAKKPSA